jgi:hypothetical protein
MPPALQSVGKLGTWYDGADSSTITYSTGISQWSDKSGFGRHATQGTGADQPIYNPTGGLVNGMPSLRFTGTSMSLFTPFFGALGLSAIEAFYVFKVDLDPAFGVDAVAGALLGNWGTDTAGEHEPFSDGNVYLGFCSTVRKTVGDPTPSLASPRIISMRSAASDWTYAIDGTTFYTTATNTFATRSVALAGQQPRIGCAPNNAGNQFGLVGNVGEIIICFGLLTARERQLLEGHLAWKWRLNENLPASHPFKNRPPLIGD